MYLSQTELIYRLYLILIIRKMLSDLLACFCPCIINATPTLKINNAKFKILSVLGEGGFSYVYLVQSYINNGLYALKKIRCPFGNSNTKIALKEVSNYKEFKNPYIIRSIDSSIVQESDGSKTIYILLPYFENGSLQDLINKNSVDGVQIDEDEAIRIFIGICRGLITLHRHHLTKNYSLINNIDQDGADGNNRDHDRRISKNGAHTNVTEINPFLDENEIGTSNDQLGEATELTETMSIAHRDIKPANIMLSKDGTPVLCDLGSCDKARVEIKTRAQAITYQELANEHCTLPYRAPELLDIKVGDNINEKIDIWSLGCTLYAMMYGSSPFEREEAVNGANLILAITSNNYSFPAAPVFGDDLKALVKMCLVESPDKRPDVEDVLKKALEIQRFRSSM